MPRIPGLILRCERGLRDDRRRRTNEGGCDVKILKGMTLVMAGVLALAAQVGAAGGVTTSVYTVDALTVPGVKTGLVLKKRQAVTVTATGTVCYWPGPPSILCVDPEGDAGVGTSDPGFVLPNATGIALIGRIGNGPWVEVGNGTTLSGKGELVFAVNDIYFPDNTGSFEVTVSYNASGVTRTCWPGWGHGDLNHDHCGPPGLANKPEQGSSNEHGKSDEDHGKSEEKGNPKK